MKQLLTACLVFFYCATANAQSSSNKDFDELKWLIGKWKMPIKSGMLYEQWWVLNDSTLQSKGFMIKATGDSIALEAVQIVLRNNKLFYIPTVNGQNNNEPVPFAFTQSANQSFTAENPAHDFPQKIYYKLDGSTKLYAEVSGMKNGTLKKEQFSFTKD